MITSSLSFDRPLGTQEMNADRESVAFILGKVALVMQQCVNQLWEVTQVSEWKARVHVGSADMSL